jgi:hypothetical protein
MVPMLAIDRIRKKDASTQIERINQITSSTLIVGEDIGGRALVRSTSKLICM